MKNNIPSIRIPYRQMSALFCAAAFAALTATGTVSLNAATVLDFAASQTHVVADTSFARVASGSGSGPYTSLNAFSDTAPLSPASGYTGPAFYGGYSLVSTAFEAGFTRQQIRNNYTDTAGNDAIFIQAVRTEGWAGTTLSFASVFIFKQSDFSEPFQSGEIGVTGFNVTYYNGSTSGSESDRFYAMGRWLVSVGAQYYLSESVIDNGRGLHTASLSGEDLAGMNWALYNPETSVAFDAGAASFQPLTLSGVTAVGVYFEDPDFVGQPSASANAMALGISSFSVEGSVIPEPSQGALILFGGGALLAGARLRQQQAR